MFDFMKKNDEFDADDIFAKREIVSKVLQFELEHGETDWNDEKIQLYIPVVLAFVDWEWLDLIAKHNVVKEDYDVFMKVLEVIKTVYEINNKNLEREMMFL